MRSARTWHGLHPFRRPPARPVVTVGVFDGVHIAHQALIRSTIRLAHRLRGTSVVITFDPDPRRVLDPARGSEALLPLRVRLERIRALGVDHIWVIPFTKRFARLSAGAFVRRFLLGRLHAAAVVIGEDFAFGSKRRGDPSVLERLGHEGGMRVAAVRHLRRGGAPVSSSRIRRLIAAGKLAEAGRLLGRAPILAGVVRRGTGRGRRLGFPTANIELGGQLLPPPGVYAVRVRTAHPAQAWAGAMNLGVRPTFGAGPLVCEVHLLGFSGSLRGRDVRLDLLARLRGERCFASEQALARHIALDVARVRRLAGRQPALSGSPTVSKRRSPPV